MDIEEQLDRAEKLPYPSLVGSSVKSADDSPHNNYIHPEKYTGNCNPVQKKKSLLNQQIGASLDDLISEGALLGSEEDFDRFLDDKGNVRSDAKYLAKSSSGKDSNAPLHLRESTPDDAVLSPAPEAHSEKATLTDLAASESIVESVASGDVAPGSSIYGAENFSTPNLSEYQLDHQIADHTELLDSVKSYDLSKLPSSKDSELKSKSNDAFGIAERVSYSVRPSTAKGNQAFAAQPLEYGENANVVETDSLHTPFFQRDERSPSRSRFPVSRIERSRSRSTDRHGPRSHLARGDSYKNTHDDLPSKYELPAGLDVEEENEEDARESRRSRPTLGESVAAAEEEIRKKESQSVTRDPSLVTSGDYTNFNVDGSSAILTDKNLYLVRSESSTNYLRSISRSRSRQPGSNRDATHLLTEKNEKNDANPAELVSEGAYVSDDPYGQVDGLDDMMKKVLTTGTTQTDKKSQKNLVNDVSAIKKVTETKEQSIPEQNEVSEENEEKKDNVEKKEDENDQEEDEEGEGEGEEKDAEKKENEEISKGDQAEDVEKEELETGLVKQSDSSKEEAMSILDTVKAKAGELVESLSEATEVAEPEAKDIPGSFVAAAEVEEAETTEAETPDKSDEEEKKAEVSSERNSSELQVEKEAEFQSKNAEAAVVAEEDDDEELDVSPEELKKHLESLPIYLFTSLAGGMQIVNRTNRLVTILKANGIKFEYRDLGTDEEAKKIWRRYAQGKTLPGIARDDEIIGNWEYIEEVNEDYRLREVLYETL